MSVIKSLVSLCVLAVVGFGIYANSLNSEFHFDDFIYVVENKGIRNLYDIEAIRKSLPRPSRFVTFFTFAANYHIHQLDVRGYHIVNVAIHIINAWLLWWLALIVARSKRLVDDTVIRPRMYAFAFLSALVFLSHPIQTESVTYICQRFTSLVTFFYLLTLCCYAQGRQCQCAGYRWALWIVAGVSVVLGMFTKEIMMTVPIIVVIFEVMFLSDGQWGWRSVIRRPFFWVGGALVLFLLGIIPAIFSFQVKSTLTMETESWSYLGDYLTSGTYFLTQLRVVSQYIRLLFLPIGQNLLYDFPTSYSLFELKTFCGFLFLSALLFLAFRLRRKFAVIAFGIFWFFITLSIESTFITIKQVIFEHRCYLPSIGFCLSLMYALFYFLRTPRRIYPIVGLIVVVLAFLTIQRNIVWSTEISLWKDVQKKSPRQERPFTYVGMKYLNKGQVDKALLEFNNALAVNPNKAESYNNRGNAYMALQKYDMALEDYNAALERDSQLERTYTNRAVILGQYGEFQKALQDFAAALNVNPENSSTYYNRGNMYLKMNQPQDARQDFLKVIALNPDSSKAYYKMGNIESVQKNYASALKYLNNALAIDPDDSKVLWNRSVVHFELGNYDRAREDANRSQNLGFNIPDTYWNKMNQKIKNSQ